MNLLDTNAVDIDEALFAAFEYNETEGGVDDHVGERSRNSKFSYVSPRSIHGETSNEGKESAST